MGEGHEPTSKEQKDDEVFFGKNDGKKRSKKKKEDGSAEGKGRGPKKLSGEGKVQRASLKRVSHDKGRGTLRKGSRTRQPKEMVRKFNSEHEKDPTPLLSDCQLLLAKNDTVGLEGQEEWGEKVHKKKKTHGKKD